jgi:Cytochrome c
VLGLVVFWVASAPRPLPQSYIPAHIGNVANGEILYNAGGCKSCHKANAEVAGIDKNLPSGGSPLKTPIGTLYPPNITPDKDTGIGAWTDLQFVNAVQRGIGGGGEHLIPAFPYTSYAAMKVEDVLDIKAYLMSLKPVNSATREADIPVAFVLRRGIGLWKWAGLDTTLWKPDAAQTESWNRGSYLVNGPGHCGECHTPRNPIMAKDNSRFLMGGLIPRAAEKCQACTVWSKASATRIKAIWSSPSRMAKALVMNTWHRVAWDRCKPTCQNSPKPMSKRSRNICSA